MKFPPSSCINTPTSTSQPNSFRVHSQKRDPQSKNTRIVRSRSASVQAFRVVANVFVGTIPGPAVWLPEKPLHHQAGLERRLDVAVFRFGDQRPPDRCSTASGAGDPLSARGPGGLGGSAPARLDNGRGGAPTSIVPALFQRPSTGAETVGTARACSRWRISGRCRRLNSGLAMRRGWCASSCGSSIARASRSRAGRTSWRRSVGWWSRRICPPCPGCWPVSGTSPGWACRSPDRSRRPSARAPGSRIPESARRP